MSKRGFNLKSVAGIESQLDVIYPRHLRALENEDPADWQSAFQTASWASALFQSIKSVLFWIRQDEGATPGLNA